MSRYTSYHMLTFICCLALIGGCTFAGEEVEVGSARGAAGEGDFLDAPTEGSARDRKQPGSEDAAPSGAGADAGDKLPGLEGEGTKDPTGGGAPSGVLAGGECNCDADCVGTSVHAGVCIDGICGALGSEPRCEAGSGSACPADMRCWSGSGTSLCYPDYFEGRCAGVRDPDGSCVANGAQGCDRACGIFCDRSGGGPDSQPNEPGTEPDSQPREPGTEPDSQPDFGDGGAQGDQGDGLGTCTGTEEECFAARVINDFRQNHLHAGECNNALRWDARLGQLAHAHQSGPFVRHSSHGYVENVGQAYGVRETAEYIVSWEPVIEEHCRADGSYTVSHHCAAMFCNNETIGVGVYLGSGGAVYMTMMFGDAQGNPSW